MNFPMKVIYSVVFYIILCPFGLLHGDGVSDRFLERGNAVIDQVNLLTAMVQSAPGDIAATKNSIQETARWLEGYIATHKATQEEHCLLQPDYLDAVADVVAGINRVLQTFNETLDQVGRSELKNKELQSFVRAGSNLYTMFHPFKSALRLGKAALQEELNHIPAGEMSYNTARRRLLAIDGLLDLGSKFFAILDMKNENLLSRAHLAADEASSSNPNGDPANKDEFLETKGNLPKNLRQWNSETSMPEPGVPKNMTWEEGFEREFGSELPVYDAGGPASAGAASSAVASVSGAFDSGAFMTEVSNLVVTTIDRYLEHNDEAWRKRIMEDFNRNADILKNRLGSHVVQFESFKNLEDFDTKVNESLQKLFQHIRKEFEALLKGQKGKLFYFYESPFDEALKQITPPLVAFLKTIKFRVYNEACRYYLTCSCSDHIEDKIKSLTRSSKRKLSRFFYGRHK